MASIAANFRSTCDSERGAPEFSTQRSRTAAPHVGQGTEDICLGVSSLFFTLTECGNTQSQICSLLHTAAQLVIRGQMNFGHASLAAGAGSPSHAYTPLLIRCCVRL